MPRNTIDKLNILPPGAIKPEGWLLSQLKLTNNLQKKLGCNSELLRDGEWVRGETFPRYVRGLILLAGVLNEPVLKEKMESFMSPIFSSANEGGDFGPDEGRFLSPKIEAIKTVLSYCELTGDEKALVFLRKFFKNQFNTFGITPCWYHSRARLLEEIPAIERVFKETDAEWLHDLAERLRETSTNWFKLAERFPYKKPANNYISQIAAARVKKLVESYESATESDLPDAKELTVDKSNREWKKSSHCFAVQTSGVSVAKAVKYPCIYGRFIGDDELKELSLKLIANVERYHGNATGMFSSDFRLAGTCPTRGIDVESAVEMIESLVDVIAETNDSYSADLLEQIAFNVIPAAAFEDVSAVQDILLPNQEEASVERASKFKHTESGNAFISGKLSRGAVALISAYPLFMQSLCMTREKELDFLTYAPCTIETVIDGYRIKIKEETGYPFRNTIIFKVEEAEGDPELKINFRVPGNTAMQLVSGGQVVATGAKSISVKCVLKKGSTFMLKLDIPLVAVENRDETISLMKGNVLMASRFVSETGTSAEDKHIFDVRFVKRWNFAPVVSKHSSNGLRRLYDSEQTIVNTIGEIPFSHDRPPFELKIKSKNVLNWDYDLNGVPFIPKKPQFSEETMERSFVPIGCTSVRMSHFPLCVKANY